jgi:hypothetical protein
MLYLSNTVTGDITHGAAGRLASGRDPTMPGVLNDGLVIQAGLPPAADALLKGKGTGAAPANGPAAAGFGSVFSEPGAVSPGYPHLGHALSDAAIANLDQSRNGRRLLGQGLMFQGTGPGGVSIMQQQQQQQPPVRTPVSVLNQVMTAATGRPIVKGWPLLFRM